MLVGIHGGLAILTGRMEWTLDTDSKIFDGLTEAEFLAKSIKDVAQHYGAGLFDQKTLDWANLTQCLLIVYGGRIFAIRSTPKATSPRKPTVQETAGVHTPPQNFHVPQPGASAPRSNGHDAPANRASIAGVGEIDLPDTHPLSPHFKGH